MFSQQRRKLGAAAIKIVPFSFICIFAVTTREGGRRAVQLNHQGLYRNKESVARSSHTISILPSKIQKIQILFLMHSVMPVMPGQSSCSQ